jgi:hypothetical protein
MLQNSTLDQIKEYSSPFAATLFPNAKTHSLVCMHSATIQSAEFDVVGKCHMAASTPVLMSVNFLQLQDCKKAFCK